MLIWRSKQGGVVYVVQVWMQGMIILKTKNKTKQRKNNKTKQKQTNKQKAKQKKNIKKIIRQNLYFPSLQAKNNCKIPILKTVIATV